MRVATANDRFVDRYPGEACIGGSFGPAAERDWHRQYSDFIHVSTYMNSAAGLRSRPSRVRINYAALHSQGVKLHTPVMPTDDDLDSDVSVMSESSMAGANQQVGVASAEVDTLMALSEEQLDEALRQAQLEGAELVKRQKAQELLVVRKIKEDLRRTRLVDPVPAPVQRQAAPTHRTSFSGLHARFEPQLTLRDPEFLDQEAEGLVRGEVGTRYGLRDDVNRPVAEDFERPADKRGEKSGLRQVLSDNRTFFPQLCPQEYLRFEHVRDPIKFDDLDLRLYTAGELNIIDRPDISHIEMRGRLDLLKNILYLAGYYEWRGILQFYATIINQIEMGVKDWDSDFSEEGSLVLLPYALSNRRDRPHRVRAWSGRQGSAKIWADLLTLLTTEPGSVGRTSGGSAAGQTLTGRSSLAEGHWQCSISAPSVT